MKVFALSPHSATQDRLLVHDARDPAKDVRACPALVVVAGLPGSGKGTQCAQIASDFGIAHLSVGEALRQEVKRQTPLGRRVNACLQAGRLAPTGVVLELITAELARNEDAPAVFLDGFPRTLAQARALERVHPGSVVVAFLLDVPLPKVVERLRRRGRVDDGRDALRERLASFERDTTPALDWYRRRGILVTIDANRSQSDVTVAMKSVLTRRAPREFPGTRHLGERV